MANVNFKLIHLRNNCSEKSIVKKPASVIAVISIGVVLQLLVTHAACASPIDGINLYNDKKYVEARQLFEQNLHDTMSSPLTYYYYALTLKALGENQAAVRVCNNLIKRYPNTAAANQCKVALARWSSGDIGVVGLKFMASPRREARIVSVFEGTPASEALLQNGDYIAQVDGKSTLDLNTEQVYRLIVGRPGSTVRLTIRRGDVTYEKSLKRMHSKEFGKTHPDIYFPQ
jgi:C-terminal processing protease CtpA/Prc